MNAVRDYRSILRVAVFQRDAVVSRALQSVMLFLACAGLAVAAFFKLKKGEDVSGLLVHGTIGIGAFWLAAAWIFFVPASTRMNSAANAKLVPRQRRRLLQLAAAWWLLASGGIALAFANWAIMPLAGVYMLVLAMGVAGASHAWILIVVTGNWHWTLGRVLPLGLIDLALGRPGKLVMSMLMAVCGIWVLRWLYPAGGDRHAARFERQRELAQRFASRGGTHQTSLNQGGSLSMMALYGRALRRDCRRADPATLLAHALGPSCHWSTWLPGVFVIVLLAAGAAFALTWFGGQLRQLLDIFSTMGVVSIAVAIGFSTAAYSQLMARTQGEQALLRLTPLAGDSRLLNRRLGGRLLRLALMNFAMITATVLLVTAVLGGGSDVLTRELALCCLAFQAALLGLFLDYANGERWNQWRALAATGLGVGQLILAALFGAATGTSLWPWLIVSSAVVALAELRHGWARMLAAPPAYPAGRLA